MVAKLLDFPLLTKNVDEKLKDKHAVIAPPFHWAMETENNGEAHTEIC